MTDPEALFLISLIGGFRLQAIQTVRKPKPHLQSPYNPLSMPYTVMLQYQKIDPVREERVVGYQCSAFMSSQEGMQN